jgi:hypothetical protein
LALITFLRVFANNLIDLRTKALVIYDCAV